MRLGSLARRPHELMEMELSAFEALSFDLTVLRASERHRATEAIADMQEMEAHDEMGIGRAIAMLFRLVTKGR